MRVFFILCIMLFGHLIKMPAQYKVTVINSTYESLTLRAVGHGKKAALAVENAELSALNAVLFVGHAGTAFPQPLINEDRNSIESKHKSVFDDFYSGQYRDYIGTSVIVTPFGKNELKQKCITIDVSVRVKALRTYLENKGIIRKFGF
ncbi:MAG: hypothetical protein J6C65_04560 [Prevotella sp.]|nr:hypothetical protein [Prevotella sp.]